jgi:hypothetical protein
MPTMTLVLPMMYLLVIYLLLAITKKAKINS